MEKELTKEGQSCRMKSEFKPWETKYFGVNVYCLYPDVNDLDLDDRDEKRYEYSLVDSKEFKIINALESKGFKYLVATVELESKFLHAIPPYNVSPVKSEEVPTLEKIAYDSFVTGRLYAEYPWVDAKTMHSEWIRNCCNKTQAEEVFVFHYGEIPTGFIAVKRNGNVGDIVLIAVDNNYRNKKFGEGLVEAALRWASDLRLEKMIVRTELTNTSAVRLYEKCGFKFTGGGIYLGRWVE